MARTRGRLLLVDDDVDLMEVARDHFRSRGYSLAWSESPLEAIEKYRSALVELEADGLLQLDEGYMKLTERGRLLSNTVFEKFLAEPPRAKRGIKNPELNSPALKVLK